MVSDLQHRQAGRLSRGREMAYSQPVGSKVDLERRPDVGFLRWQVVLAQVGHLSSPSVAGLPPLPGRVDMGWVLGLVPVVAGGWVEK